MRNTLSITLHRASGLILWLSLSGSLAAGTPGISIDSVSPNGGAGSNQTFRFQFSDSSGTANLKSLYMWFTPAFSSNSTAGTCLILIDSPNSNPSLKLRNDAGTAWLADQGTSADPQNSQCTLSRASLQTTAKQPAYVVTLNVKFASSFGGDKQIWMLGSEGPDGAAEASPNSGWVQAGAWRTSDPATVVDVTLRPNPGTDWSLPVDLDIKDSNGVSDLQSLVLWFTPAFSGNPAGTCQIKYDIVGYRLSLLNDAGTAWINSGPTGVKNSRCSIAGAQRGAESASVFSFHVEVQFDPTFAGAKEIWAYATGATGNSGWRRLGDWTVPPPIRFSGPPISGSMRTLPLLFYTSDVYGMEDLRTISIWVTPTFSASGNKAGTCFVEYHPEANGVLLAGDSGTTWSGTQLGGQDELRNGQCAVSIRFQRTYSNDAIGLFLEFSFSSSYTGPKEIWLSATGGKANAGWQMFGTLTVTPRNYVTLTSSTVSEVTGTSGKFTFGLVDTAGSPILQQIEIWVGPPAPPNPMGGRGSSCIIHYSPALDRFNILENSGWWGYGAPAGIAWVLENGQCSLDLSRSGAVRGTDLTVTLALSFPAKVSGPQTIWVLPVDPLGSGTGYMRGGTFTVVRPAPCSATAAPAAAEAAAQTIAVSVTTTPGCVWPIAATDSWLSVQAAGTRTGSAIVLVDVTANTSGAPRTGYLTIGASKIPVSQAGSSRVFADVPLENGFFDPINALYQRGITNGCLGAPLSFCPGSNITRGETAVFIVRSIMGNDNFAYTTQPYFDDVPATHGFFKWIQKLRDLGITRGCGATTFCPDLRITRGEMAALIIRGRFGASELFDFPYTPYFTDVDRSHAFFSWIQEMQKIGITSGCQLAKYCPDSLITRGETAVFVMRGMLNQFLPVNTPVLISVTPATASPGQTVTVTVTARDAEADPGRVVIRAGAGITVDNVSFTGFPVTARFQIAADAVLGPRSISAFAHDGEATLPNGFWVQ